MPERPLETSTGLSLATPRNKYPSRTTKARDSTPMAASVPPSSSIPTQPTILEVNDGGEANGDETLKNTVSIFNRKSFGFGKSGRK